MSDLELTVDRLCVAFGRRTILNDISFAVKSGEFVSATATSTNSPKRRAGAKGSAPGRRS